MTNNPSVRGAARALVLAVFEHLRTQERAVRLQPSKWMELMPDWGQSVLSLAEYHQLEKALESAFPDRFAGPLGRHELASQYIWAVLDGVVLRAADLHLEFELRPADLAAAVDEMLDLVLRDRDRAVAARVVSDITLDAPFSVGGVELRPVGNWGLTDAYRDIDGFMPGAGRLLDAEIGYRTGPSFTFATLITHTDAAVGDRMGEGYSAAKRLALARAETLTSALRLATATTSQAVVDITAAPGHVRFYRPEIVRHDFGFMELVQRIGHIQPEHAAPIAALGDRLAVWGGDDKNPHSLGIALSRFGRSFVTRSWFDMLVDIAVGIEAALLGGSEQEEIGLRLRSRAAALLATPTDPPTRIYSDIKCIYGLRSLVVHGSNPTTKELEAQAYKISSTERTTWRGVKWALALDRARDLLRRAILARGFLLDLERWPAGRKGRHFDVDAQLIDPNAREEWRESWRGALEQMGLVTAAGEAAPAALDVALPDHSYGPRGSVPDAGGDA
jgi:hypothetical protein